LHAALREYEKYSVAWVTLGQVLAAETRPDEARQACSQASVVEPSFAPAYLCLADMAARAHDWSDVLKSTERALKLGPLYAPVAYEYDAAANLNLHNLAAAEKSGLQAVQMDLDHREPRAHFVLAQIYEAKGDKENEARQLREYLKYANDAADIAVVKNFLLQLETPASTTIVWSQALLRSLMALPIAAGPVYGATLYFESRRPTHWAQKEILLYGLCAVCAFFALRIRKQPLQEVP
jgi:Tfp pilus assembly protein PilF